MADVMRNESGASGAYISERHRNPAELMAQAPRTNYTAAGICAIIATILFGLLVAVLYLDWTAIRSA